MLPPCLLRDERQYRDVFRWRWFQNADPVCGVGRVRGDQTCLSSSVDTAVKGVSRGVLPPGTSKSPRRSRSMRYAAVCARLRVWN